MVRPATAEDERWVSDCVNAAYGPFVAAIGRLPAPMVDDYGALIGRGVVHIAEVDGERVGVGVMWAKDDHFYVDNLAVLPDSHGSGVGTELLRVADALAAAAGLGEVRLYTNEVMTSNMAYYPRRGYVETHRAVDNGYRRIYYRKVLNLAGH